MNREELYINHLLGNTETELPKPITRVESYLSFLLGNIQDIPNPITRKEYYLFNLCAEGQANIKPTTREETYLYCLLNNITTDIKPITTTELLYNKLLENGVNSGSIVFNKWESGDWEFNSGKPIVATNKLRTPLQYKKKIEPSTKYRIIPSIANLVFGLRTFKANGTFITSFSSPNLTNGIFTSTADVDYGLFMVQTTDTSTRMELQKMTVLELGELDLSTGKPIDNTSKVRTVDYIKIEPNTQIRITISNYNKATAARWLSYDDNETLVDTWYFGLYTDGRPANTTINAGEATKLKLYMNSVDLDANIIVDKVTTKGISDMELTDVDDNSLLDSDGNLLFTQEEGV